MLLNTEVLISTYSYRWSWMVWCRIKASADSHYSYYFLYRRAKPRKTVLCWAWTDMWSER